jgi:hypothetical protein
VLCARQQQQQQQEQRRELGQAVVNETREYASASLYGLTTAIPGAAAQLALLRSNLRKPFACMHAGKPKVAAALHCVVN